MKYLYSGFILLFVLLIGGCAKTSTKIAVTVDSRTNPWTTLQFADEVNNFQFAIVGDRTSGCRPGIFERAIEDLNLLQPEFVMCVGDLIEPATESDIIPQWEEFEGMVNKLEMPSFFVPGNHDIETNAMRMEWLRRYGRTYYYFVYKDVLFCCLDTEITPGGGFGNEQLEYFDNILSEHKNVRWTLLFLHKSLWRLDGNPEWEKVKSSLNRRDYTVIAGHDHTYTKYIRNNRNHYVMGTTGGSSPFRGPSTGEMDHLVWVTMTDQGPRMAILQLDGIYGENIHTE